MGIGLSIGLVSASFLFFFAFFLFGIFYYQKRFNLKYDIRNTFPYEINYQQSFLDNIFVNIFLILFAVSSIGFFVFFDIKNILSVDQKEAEEMLQKLIQAGAIDPFPLDGINYRVR